MTRSTYPRDILNRLKWQDDESLDDVQIVILHRGAMDNKRIISGKEIVSIGHLFFETTETSIPYHRILEIRYRGEKLFEKNSK